MQQKGTYMTASDELKVGLVQMAPVWLNRTKTLDKVPLMLRKQLHRNAT
jgi:hypothetical protein